MNSLNRTWCLLVICLSTFFIASGQQKSFQVVPFEQGYSDGVDGDIFNWNDTLFFSFLGTQNGNKLGKFSGGHVQVLSSPNNDSQIKIVGGFSVLKSKLYFVTGVSNRYLSVYNYADSTIKQFANPDNGYGVEPKAFTFKNQIYYLYRNSSDNVCLVRLTDSGPKIVFTPTNSSIFEVYADNDFMIFNIGYGVVKFDGSSVKYIKGTTENFYIGSNFVKCNS